MDQSAALRANGPGPEPVTHLTEAPEPGGLHKQLRTFVSLYEL